MNHRKEINVMRHPERPHRPESGCGEHPDKPIRPEIGRGEHPHLHFHPPFPPPGGMQGPRRPKRHRPPLECGPHDFDFYLALADELSLSEEQVKQLQSIISECQKSNIMSRARIEVGELELQGLLDQPELDRSKVDAKIREIGEIKIESHINDIHAMIDAREVLTQEQKEKLKKLRPIPWNGRF
jgi:Spy/CpxP family protein refolding chaperone